ncbi:MAG: serine protease [Pseudomonadota bacterium]
MGFEPPTETSSPEVALEEAAGAGAAAAPLDGVRDGALGGALGGEGPDMALETPVDPGETEDDFGSRASMMSPETICPGQAQIHEVINYRKYPWSALVYVRAHYRRFGNDPLVISGTGWMVASGLVITAAHNVFKHTMTPGARRAIKVELFSGYAQGERQMAARTEIEARDVLFSPRFAEGPPINRPYDYAFLRVRDGGFTASVGRPLPLVVVEPGCRDSVLIGGYPVPAGAGIHLRKGRLHTGDRGLAPGGNAVTLRYAIQTLGGQSGGPVIWVNPADHSQIAAIGIHVHGECPCNMARRIDPGLFELAQRLASGVGV